MVRLIWEIRFNDWLLLYSSISLELFARDLCVCTQSNAVWGERNANAYKSFPCFSGTSLERRALCGADEGEY